MDAQGQPIYLNTPSHDSWSLCPDFNAKFEWGLIN